LKGALPSKTQIIDSCRLRLDVNKKPSQVFFTDALPSNDSGKVLKPKLRHYFGSTQGV
jgi:acyl-CoA synthetase (AMP-forming)/AMP-acid ligase II